MTPDEATVALYKCISNNREKTLIEEVKQYVEAGARLRDIETLYGPPLLCALENMCPIPILNYLIEKGGIVWSYKKGKYLFYSETEPTISLITITYNTIRNQLIYLWHFCKGSRKADNQVLLNIFKIYNIPEEEYKYKLFRYPYKVDENYKPEYYDEEFCTELNLMHEARYKRICRQYGGESYARQVCELFNVTPEELEDGILELPTKKYDIKLLPKEDKPYCWDHYIDKPVGHAFDQLFLSPHVEDEESAN